MIPDLPRIRKSKDWHLQRMKGIGGSDWAAILSDHYPHEYKWSCLRRLYYTKKGIKPDFPEKTSRAAQRGTILGVHSQTRSPKQQNYIRGNLYLNGGSAIRITFPSCLEIRSLKAWSAKQ